MKIEEIDINFKATELPDGVEMEYYNIEESPFNIFGVFKDNGVFRRLPKNIGENVNDGVDFLHMHTSGGRVLFKTDSRYISIIAKLNNISRMTHFTLIGTAGFDLYDKKTFKGSFRPEWDIKDGFTGIIWLKNKEMRELTINFPLYSGVDELYVGIEKGAVLEEYNPYKNVPPIVYYGSSITQGGCASRPGNSYQCEIMRQTDIDYINLGFSGSARGEEIMAEYISKLPMSIFVMDYDHNAENSDWLRNTHEKFFKIIREKNKDLPILFVTKPDFKLENEDDHIRRDVIYNTYINAYNSGDRNVYYLDGSSIFGSVSRSYATVDGCHPNDMGFYMMAQCIGNAIKEILEANNI